jgi:uracil phosphoribosyltransferase
VRSASPCSPSSRPRQGIDRIADENPGVRFVVGAVDPRLNDHGFIVPGLGDFGDRLYGTL